MGIVPQYNNDGLALGNENGPRRQEHDGFTYFGVEDGLKDDEEEEDDDKNGLGATGGFIEDATGEQIPKKYMNDFIIPMNNPNNSGDASKDQPSINPMMGGGSNNH